MSDDWYTCKNVWGIAKATKCMLSRQIQKIRTSNLSFNCQFTQNWRVCTPCTSTFIRQSLPFDCKDALLLVSTLPPRAGGGGGCLWREEFSFLRSANKLHSKDQQNLLLSSHKKTVLTEIDSEAFEIFSRYFTEANIHAQQQEPNKVLIIINNYYNNNNFIGWHNYWYFSSLHCGP